MKIHDKIIDFLLPPLCPVTGEFVDKIGMVSPYLWRDLSFIHAPYCETCGIPFAFDADTALCGHCIDQEPYYTQSRSALVYDDISRDLILKFKHGDQLHAVKAFTPWLQQAGADLLSNTDIVTPVPLHPMRLLKRRYNQADIIARDLIRDNDIPYIPDLLKRTRNTQSQGHKKAKDRIRNIRNAFTVHDAHRANIQNRSVLVIDDVYTTGATVNECAKTLLKYGARHVYVLTLARVIQT